MIRLSKEGGRFVSRYARGKTRDDALTALHPLVPYRCYACGEQSYFQRPIYRSRFATACRYCDRVYPQVCWRRVEPWQTALQLCVVNDVRVPRFDPSLTTDTPHPLAPATHLDTIEIRTYLCNERHLRLGLTFVGGNIVVVVPADQNSGALRSMLDKPLAAILADLHRTGDLNATKLALAQLLGEPT